jgi:hypothetical protein
VITVFGWQVTSYSANIGSKDIVDRVLLPGQPKAIPQIEVGIAAAQANRENKVNVCLQRQKVGCMICAGVVMQEKVHQKPMDDGPSSRACQPTSSLRR